MVTREESKIDDELAAVLGVAPRTLFVQETLAERSTPHPEEAILEAALATCKAPISPESLAAALSWPLDRTINALESLGQHLPGTGLRLNQTSDGYSLGVQRHESYTERCSVSKQWSGGR